MDSFVLNGVDLRQNAAMFADLGSGQRANPAPEKKAKRNMGLQITAQAANSRPDAGYAGEVAR
jgi:hypothetical protein